MKRIVCFVFCLMFNSGVVWADETISLKVQWPAGSELVMLLDSAESVVMDSDSFQQTLTRAVDQNLRLDIDVDPESTQKRAVLRLTVDRFEVDVSSPERKYHYASDSGEPTDLLGRILSDFAGLKLQAVLKDGGKSIEYLGTEELDGLVSRGGEQSPVLSQLLGRQVIEQMLTRNLTCPWLPEHSVEPGDAWTTTLETENDRLGTVSTRYTYTFEEWKEGKDGQVAVLTFTGAVDLGDESLPEALTLNDAEITGSVLFDVTKGRLLKFNVMQQLGIAIQVQQGDASIVINTRSSKKVNISILER